MNLRTFRRAMSVFLLVSLRSGLIASEWHVAPPPLGNNKNPGTQQLPFATIQRGIDAASHADTVIVAQGTYVEKINFGGKNIVLRSTNPADWSVVKETIIDANKAGSVVTFYGTEDETCVLSGFTIRNGTGTLAPDGSMFGGGICGTAELVTPLGRMTHATIRNNIITGNRPGNAGGIGGCAGLIENCIISSNWAAGSNPNGYGGAMLFCNGTIQNNLMVGNYADSCGGALSFCNAVFRNNVVVGNTDTGHGALAHHGTSPYTPPGGSITNCIIWGNTSPTAQVGDSVAPSHCCIQDWTGGATGSIALDPQFGDPDGPDDDPATYEDNDYRLLPVSPCIDKGVNEDWMNTATDLDGKPRILLGASSLTVDMGAYEYSFDVAIVRNTESEVELSWTMRPLRTYTVLSSSDMLLQPWAEETTIVGGKTGGPASWIDPGAASALKFYRIAIQ